MGEGEQVMDPISQGTVVVRYENKGGYLIAAGVPLDRETIAKLPGSKVSYNPKGCEDQKGNVAACGRVTFLVGSEEGARELLNQLWSSFHAMYSGSEKYFSLDYRGATAVPIGSLGSVVDRRGLCGLVNETLEKEAMGKITPGELETIDYNAVASDLPEVLMPEAEVEPENGEAKKRVTDMLEKRKQDDDEDAEKANE